MEAIAAAQPSLDGGWEAGHWTPRGPSLNGSSFLPPNITDDVPCLLMPHLVFPYHPLRSPVKFTKLLFQMLLFSFLICTVSSPFCVSSCIQHHHRISRLGPLAQPLRKHLITPGFFFIFPNLPVLHPFFQIS